MTRDMDSSLPSVDQLGRELLRLLRSSDATLTLASDLPGLMSLHVVGGPSPPGSEEEVAHRLQKLWTLLRGYMGGPLERELADNAIVDDETTAQACVEAARLIFRARTRGTTWRLAATRDLPRLEKLRKDADALLRPSAWGANRKTFERRFQSAILAALARLLLKDEEAKRAGSDPPTPTAPDTPEPDRSEQIEVPGPDDAKPVPPDWRRARWRVGAASILIAGLAALVAIVAAGGSEDHAVASASDLNITLDVRSSSGLAAPEASRDGVAALALADNAADLTFRAVVRGRGDTEGSIPKDLYLVVDIPQVSLTSKVLPSAHLARGDDPIPETGQRASDAATVLARDSRRIALDLPTHLLVSAPAVGGTQRRSLPRRYVRCAERSCTVRVPIARYASHAADGDILRLDFDVMAFTPRRNGPLLLIDMEQRRLDHTLSTDGEIAVSPGEQVVYSFSIANRGNRPARKMLVRAVLGQHLRVRRGSARVSTPGAATPYAADDNLANGGLRYRTVGPGARAHFSVIAGAAPSARHAGEVYPYLLVRSADTGRHTYYDSVTTRIIAADDQ